MAIYHLTVKALGRTKNHKAVAAAAYRSGTKLRDERYETIHDYTGRKGVVHSEILLPTESPDWAGDRERLWNEVEKCEKRKDSQVAREIEVALPRELSPDQSRELLRRFCTQEVAARGMIADLAIHERDATDGGTNPHAHVMVTMRQVSRDGFGAKERDWNSTELVETWRERWAVCCNEALAAAGEEARIDHRSLEEQGIMREPTIHLGKDAHHASQKGREVARVERQLSPVERSAMPYERQIEEQGHIELVTGPAEGQSWWEKTVSFTRRVGEQAREWYGGVRERWQGWFERGREGPEEEEPPGQGQTR